MPEYYVKKIIFTESSHLNARACESHPKNKCGKHKFGGWVQKSAKTAGTGKYHLKTGENKSTLRYQIKSWLANLFDHGAVKQAERDDLVERTIKSLLEFDEMGRQLVREAQEQRADVLAHMEDYKKELGSKYRERMQNRLDFTRGQAEAEAAEKLAAARAEYAARSQRLEETYRENSARWVAEIVRRCIGG